MRDRHRFDEVRLKARLDGGLDLLDSAYRALDLGPRAPIEQRNPGAGAGRVPGRGDVLQGAVRHQPEHHRELDVDVAPERPRQPDAVDPVDPEPIHQQPHSGVERRLGELDGPDIVLRHPHFYVAPVQHVGERASVLDDPVAALRPLGADHAVLVDDPGEIHLGHDLDDARAADPRDLGRGELGCVRPCVVPDDAEARLQGGRIDPDPLDGARCGPLAAAYLGAFERRAGGARRREHPFTVAEHDLGVGADVHDEAELVAQVRRLGEDDARGIGAHVPRHAREHVGARARMETEIERARRYADGTVDSEGERRLAELDRIQTEQEVMHDRIADQGHVEDLFR